MRILGKTALHRRERKRFRLFGVVFEMQT